MKKPNIHFSTRIQLNMIYLWNFLKIANRAIERTNAIAFFVALLDENITSLLVRRIIPTHLFSRSTSLPLPLFSDSPISRNPRLGFSRQDPRQDKPIEKTKVLHNSCNQFVYNFYPQSILILEECLQKRWNANLI